MHTYVLVFTVYVCIGACVCACMHVCACVCMCVHVCVYVCVCVRLSLEKLALSAQKLETNKLLNNTATVVTLKTSCITPSQTYLISLECNELVHLW